MKTIIAGALIAMVMLPPISIPIQSNQQQVEMQLLEDDVFQNKVKIFDYQGNLLKEMSAEDVAHDEITLSDFLILEHSGFAFEYLGDYYYLRDW